MSWDIHGEPLAPGCCEVHPWVREPFPCGICVADSRRYEEQRQEEEAFWHAQQDEYYAGLQMDDWVASDLGPVAFTRSTPHA